MSKKHSDLYRIVIKVLDERLINFQNPIKMYGNTMKSMFFRRRKSKHDRSQYTGNSQNAQESKGKDHQGSKDPTDTFI